MRRLVDDLQDFKTECYKKIVETASPRPGVLELMDSAIATPGLAVGICSASTRAGFEKVVDAVVGQERLAKVCRRWLGLAWPGVARLGLARLATSSFSVCARPCLLGVGTSTEAPFTLPEARRDLT